MLIMRNLNLISVQSWTYLEVVTSHDVKWDYNQENIDDVVEQARDYLAVKWDYNQENIDDVVEQARDYLAVNIKHFWNAS